MNSHNVESEHSSLQKLNAQRDLVAPSASALNRQPDWGLSSLRGTGAFIRNPNAPMGIRSCNTTLTNNTKGSISSLHWFSDWHTILESSGIPLGSIPTPEVKRQLQKTAVITMRNLNNYLAFIYSREERIRFRGKLAADGRLEKTLKQMADVCKGSVLFQKQMEVYEDDRNEDM